MLKIYAFDKNFIIDYLTKIENATAEDRKIAFDLYSKENDLPKILTIIDNKAYINISGPLSKKGPSFIDRFFGYGGTSYQMIIDSVKIAEENENIEQIIFNMDTPGGEVSGVDEVFQAINKCKKNTIAINQGLTASAGYWIASACNKIYASGKSALTGSIGVVITAVDTSKFYEEHGIKIVEIVSRNAPKKRPDIKTKSGRDVLQETADSIENVFISRIASGRKKTIEDVRKNFGRGAVLVAKDDIENNDSISIGMIDGLIEIGSKGEHKFINNKISSIEDKTGSVDSAKTIPEEKGEIKTEVHNMNLQEFLASNPDAMSKYSELMKAEYDKGIEAGKAEVQKKVDAACKYLGKDEYKGIDKLVTKVLTGESEISALEGAVTAFDMMKEQGKSDQAITDTDDIGDVATENNHDLKISDKGEVKNENDYQAAIARSKKALSVGGGE
jgi:ClpP class serine protease